MHSQKRNATVTCHTDVSLLSIDRDDFVDIFMHVESGKEPEHVAYLRRIDLLREWPIDKIPFHEPRICLLTFYRKGVVICRDSFKNDWIYFVKQGSCRVLKEIKLLKKNVLSANDTQSFNAVNYLDAYKSATSSSNMNSLLNNQKRVNVRFYTLN
jgi:CRP-like cAMP-binding protein